MSIYKGIKEMIVYGAGMAGLLAGNMLSKYNPKILEFQGELPNNHAALLRFRSDVASRELGIEFKKVDVSKAISYGGEILSSASIPMQNMYSQKVTGDVIGRSIKSLEPVTRYIAPEDLIPLMAKDCNIQYGNGLTKDGLRDLKGNSDQPIISTIPMPLLMNMVGWEKRPNFKWSRIWSVTYKILSPNTEVYQTIYYPATEPFYRASITGDILIMEWNVNPATYGEEEVDQFAKSILEKDFGIAPHTLGTQLAKCQEYGKLLPIPNSEREEFIMYMTDNYGIYSLGRFATWRQLLLDDIVLDVRKIEEMVGYRINYKKRIGINV